jgi:raffinose/stachyose/melibiose transport system substrate-binding protein
MQRRTRPWGFLPVTTLAATAVAALTALAGCAAGPGSAAANSSGSATSGTLSISSTTTEKPALEAVIALFEKKYPGVHVQTSFADTDQYQATLRTELTAGTAPDVIHVWPGNGNPAAMQVVQPAGYLTDLSGMSWTAELPPSLKAVTQIDGKTWMLSTTVTGIGAIYNQTAMQQAGLTAPQTWSQLLAFCAAAKAKGKVAFALGIQTPWVTQLIDYALVPTTVYASDPGFDAQLATGAATFASSGWLTAMNKYLQMNTGGCFNADPLGVSYPSSLTMVAQGKALSVVQTTAALAQLKLDAPSGTTFNVLPLPATDDTSSTEMAGGAGGGYAVNAAAKNKALAEEFIEFLATPAAMDTYASIDGGTPSIPNAQYTSSPALATLIQYEKDGKTVPFMDQFWPNPKVQADHFAGVQELFDGKATPAEVLQQMQSAYKGT